MGDRVLPPAGTAPPPARPATRTAAPKPERVAESKPKADTYVGFEEEQGRNGNKQDLLLRLTKDTKDRNSLAAANEWNAYVFAGSINNLGLADSMVDFAIKNPNTWFARGLAQNKNLNDVQWTKFIEFANTEGGKNTWLAYGIKSNEKTHSGRVKETDEATLNTDSVMGTMLNKNTEITPEDIVLAAKNPNTKFAEAVGVRLKDIRQIGTLLDELRKTNPSLSDMSAMADTRLIYGVMRNPAVLEGVSDEVKGELFEKAAQLPSSLYARGLFSNSALRDEDLPKMRELIREAKIENGKENELRNGLIQSPTFARHVYSHAAMLDLGGGKIRYENEYGAGKADELGKIAVHKDKLPADFSKGILNYFGCKEGDEASKDKALKEYGLAIAEKTGMDLSELIKRAKATDGTKLTALDLKKAGLTNPEEALAALKAGVFEYIPPAAKPAPPLGAGSGEGSPSPNARPLGGGK